MRHARKPALLADTRCGCAGCQPCQLFPRFRKGVALTAIRDNATAAISLGIDFWRIKIIVDLVSSAFKAITGALIMRLNLAARLHYTSGRV